MYFVEHQIKRRRIESCFNARSMRPAVLGVDVADRAIDALVYELYGLTAEEIKIVEGKSESE